MLIRHHNIELRTSNGISLHDVTAQIESCLTESGNRNGFVTVTSRHTTTALTINENEERLLEDVKIFLCVAN